ncbi:MAG: FhaA domain-containing protein [Actinomycetota bacterium]
MARDGGVRAALRSAGLGLADPALWSLDARPAPVDIACELARAMEVGRFSRRGKTWVQTVYTVALSAQDLDRYRDRRTELVATLKDTLAWWAAEHGYALPGALRVRLHADTDLKPGQLSIEAGLRAEEAAKLGRTRRHSE